jgi:hypothetical protein
MSEIIKYYEILCHYCPYFLKLVWRSCRTHFPLLHSVSTDKKTQKYRCLMTSGQQISILFSFDICSASNADFPSFVARMRAWMKYVFV